MLGECRSFWNNTALSYIFNVATTPVDSFSTITWLLREAVSGRSHRSSVNGKTGGAMYVSHEGNTQQQNTRMLALHHNPGAGL